ncbi:bile acid:sodium symporter [Tropicibacter sp. R16_0]|uniref:bile acid:sodium symporter n=1 Tax=Tropicibacter sp. R16_0 TaxID=2821102 RepID=UPI001AD97A79|nr:bile acid:sodium symporter [Tropicibacter sp. R16_0]MBO9450066.1 bile acid:sodium symporter [Tropicibacter sp. R16_0]
MIGLVEQIGLVLMVFVIMLGMGATIEMSHLRKVVTTPKPFVVGILCQFGLMPLIAFGLANAFDFPAAIALSLIMVGATPGGTTSNLYTYYAKGDVALSVSMTVASTVMAIVMMPLAIAFYAGQYISAELQVPFSNIVVTLILVMVPVSIGALVLRYSQRWAVRLEKASGVVGIVLIAALIVKFLIENTQLFLSTPKTVIFAAILLGLAGFASGYLCSMLAGLNAKNAKTVSLETGIQNTPLTIAIITLSFASSAQLEEMLLFPTFYAFFIVITSGVVALGYRWLFRGDRLLLAAGAQQDL